MLETPALYSDETEGALLGTLLSFPEELTTVATTLPADAFKGREAQALYRAMLNLWRDGREIDTTILADEYVRLAASGSNAASPTHSDALMLILRVMNQPEYPTSYVIPEYADIIRDLWVRRTTVNQASQLATAAYDLGRDSGDLLTLSREIADGVASAYSSGMGGSQDAASAALQFLDRLDAAADGRYGVTIPTYIPRLDELFDGGWERGMLHSLFARPSVGKSMIALWSALMAAIDGHVVYYVSLEMTATELIERAMSTLCGVRFKISRMAPYLGQPLAPWQESGYYGSFLYRHTGKEPQTVHELASLAAGFVSTLPIVFLDRSSYTVDEIYALSMKESLRMAPAVIVIDHMVLLSSPPGMSTLEATQYNFVRAKALAKDLDCAVIAITQSRKVENNGVNMATKVLGMEDMYFAGDMHANRIVSLSFPEGTRVNERPPHIVVNVSKNRSGSTGIFDMRINWELYTPDFEVGEQIGPSDAGIDF